MGRKSKSEAGEKDPSVGGLVVGALLVGCMVYGAYSFVSSNISSENRAEKPSCDSALSCAVEEHRISAQVACNREIEGFANFSFRWTNTWTKPKYVRQSWDGNSRDTFRLFGDEIEFQNGFGAWQKHIYVCAYDFDRGAVVAVDVEPGRI